MHIFINLFCLLIIVTAFAVIFSSNIMVSILFLILIFIFTAVLYIIIGVEFLAFLIFVVYVGAIAILFLFVIMLLHIRTVELYNNYLNYLPIGSIIGFLFVFELFFLSWFVFSDMTSFYFADLYYELDWSNMINYQSNIHLFGDVLYNNYFIFVFVLGLLLLVSMITAIVLVVSSDIKSKDFAVVNANNVSFFSFY